MVFIELATFWKGHGGNLPASSAEMGLAAGQKHGEGKGEEVHQGHRRHHALLVDLAALAQNAGLQGILNLWFRKLRWH